MSTIEKGKMCAYFPIDTDSLKAKYHGCGEAIALVKIRRQGRRLFLHELIDFDYIGEINNATMSEDAGEILSYETADGTRLNFKQAQLSKESVLARVVVNLSGHQACLS